jgi:hypothetical protein
MWSIDDVPSQAGRVAVVTGASAKAHDQAVARALWDESERLTGVAYGPILRPTERWWDH